MEDDTLEDEDEAEVSPKRGRPPRLGSFVTIAVAILMLFGAASRVGKMPETLALFGIDRQAENRIRQEEDRLRAAITLGAIPVRGENRPVAAPPVPNRVLPPSRGEFNVDDYRGGGRASVSMTVRNDVAEDGERGDYPGSVENVQRRDDRGDDPEEPGQYPPEPARQSGPEQYVVANGDTWVKIAQRTLGDSKRWQEILRANPEAKNGLKVGMRLVIPR